MRRIVLVLALSATACSKPPEAATDGENVSVAYFVDAHTGVCIKLTWNGLVGQHSWVTMRRAPVDQCHTKQPDCER